MTGWHRLWTWVKGHRKLLLIAGKIVFGGGLIVFVGHRLFRDWPDVSGSISNAFGHYPHYLALGLLAFVGVYIIGNIRWLLLLWPHGVHLSFWPASKLWFIGHFFAQYMPGGIAGGDLIKSYYVATHRKATGRRAEAVSTVFLDRLLGITGLLGVLVIAVIVNLQQSAAYRHFWPYAAALFGAVVVVALLLFNKPLVKKIPLVMRLYMHLPHRDRVKRVYDAFHFYRRRPIELTAAFGLSLAVHTFTALEAYLFGSALGLKYTFPEYWLLLSLANVMGSIPISPVGNVGTLETACIAFFGQNVPELEAPALALAILIRLAYLLWGIPGLLLYVTHRKEIPHEPAEETVEVIEHDSTAPQAGPQPARPQLKEASADD
jgi:uncharacterized protein (TIRG00374 family)